MNCFRHKHFILLGTILLALSPLLLVSAQEAAPAPAPEAASSGAVLPGHSFHGEVFNEGPRQSAVLLEGMGNVSFAVTTTNEVARKFMNQGVAQLHGFWYFESERSFRQVAALDPECAMAYWGMAMSNLGNESRAKGFIAEAVKRREKVSDRERRYIDAVNEYLSADDDQKRKDRNHKYAEALEKLLYEYPDDLDAKAFLALQIWQNRNSGERIQSHLAIDALLDQIFAINPMHPAHHYRIHLWDYEKAEKAVAAAGACGPAAPGIAHMWHMPGHIYSRLRRYSDAAWQQEASARVDHAHMMRYGILPDQIHNFSHNNEWLIRDLMYVGRVRDALSLAKNMLELPRHPKYNVASNSGSSSGFGRARLFDVLTTYELWDELIALAASPYLEPTDIEREQVLRLRYLGVAYFQTGRPEEGRQQLAELRPRLIAHQTERDKAAEDAKQKAMAEGKDENGINEAVEQAKRGFHGKIHDLELAIAELEGREAFADDRCDEALEKLLKAQIDPLALAHVQLAAGKTDEALEAAKSYVDNHRREVQPLAQLVEVLWKANRQDEARQKFEELRAISQEIDLQSPVFARLAPIAQSLGWGEDWRVAQVAESDLGLRPPLDTLGPFRWQPTPAADWQLVDADGAPHALKQYQGKTVVLLFYLGYGCLHCAEQLKAFGPLQPEFAANDIAVLGVSSDDRDGLRISIENYKEPIPFPLVANPELDVFRAYRVYDDFENRPLHGTFIIDPQGNAIWHDISYQPFMDARFVLNEALRQRKLAELQ